MGTIITLKDVPMYCGSSLICIGDRQSIQTGIEKALEPVEMFKTQAFVILEIMTLGLEGQALNWSSVEPGFCIESLRIYCYNALMGKN